MSTREGKAFLEQKMLHSRKRVKFFKSAVMQHFREPTLFRIKWEDRKHFYPDIVLEIAVWYGDDKEWEEHQRCVSIRADLHEIKFRL